MRSFTVTKWGMRERLRAGGLDRSGPRPEERGVVGLFAGLAAQGGGGHGIAPRGC
jgi:hypothetical protein